MNLICGWCRKEFNIKIKGKDGERGIVVCPNCVRLLPSSRRTSTGEFVGAKHMHEEWKDGDVVG